MTMPHFPLYQLFDHELNVARFLDLSSILMVFNRFIHVEYLLMAISMPLLHFINDDAVDF